MGGRGGECVTQRWKWVQMRVPFRLGMVLGMVSQAGQGFGSQSGWGYGAHLKVLLFELLQLAREQQQECP